MLILEKLPIMNVKDEFTDEILDVLKPVHQEVNGELIEVYYDGEEYQQTGFFTKDGRKVSVTEKQGGVLHGILDDEEYQSIEHAYEDGTFTRTAWVKIN